VFSTCVGPSFQVLVRHKAVPIFLWGFQGRPLESPPQRPALTLCGCLLAFNATHRWTLMSTWPLLDHCYPPPLQAPSPLSFPFSPRPSTDLGKRLAGCCNSPPPPPSRIPDKPVSALQWALYDQRLPRSSGTPGLCCLLVLHALKLPSSCALLRCKTRPRCQLGALRRANTLVFWKFWRL